MAKKKHFSSVTFTCIFSWFLHHEDSKMLSIRSFSNLCLSLFYNNKSFVMRNIMYRMLCLVQIGTALTDCLSWFLTLILWFSFSGIDVLDLQSFEFVEAFSVLKLALAFFVIPLLMYTCRKKFARHCDKIKSLPSSRGK